MRLFFYVEKLDDYSYQAMCNEESYGGDSDSPAMLPGGRAAPVRSSRRAAYADARAAYLDFNYAAKGSAVVVEIAAG